MNYDKNIKKVKEYIENKNVEAFFVTALENIRYLSGFTGSNGYLIISQSQLFLITDQRYTEQAEKETSNFIILTHGLEPFSTIKKAIENLKIDTIAFESKNINNYQFRKLVEKINKIKWIPTEDVIKKIRAIKSEEEIEKIKKAVEIADKSLEKLLEIIKPNITEKEIKIELEYILAQKGSESPAFGTIVTSGKRTSLAHGKATDRKLKENDLVLIDFGACYEGYMSDMTRTIILGESSDKMGKIYSHVLKSLEKAVDFVKPDVTCNEVDNIARDVFEKHGLEKYSLRGLGHGVGLEIHEYPRVVMNNDELIKQNMVFTIEPGLYIPDIGGVRIEDIVVVRENGCEVLTKSPRIIKI